jgi:hypothetical protein
MGGTFLVLERLLKDKKAVFALFEHHALLLYLNEDEYGKKYKGAFSELHDLLIDQPNAGAWWKQLQKVAHALEPVWMLLRLCDKGTPNMVHIAVEFERVAEKLRKLPELHEASDEVRYVYTTSEKDSLLNLFLERKAYVVKDLHRGAAFFNPAYYLTPNCTDVHEAWKADLKKLLRELYPGDGDGEAAKRTFVLEYIERMHRHEAPCDDPDCLRAAAVANLDCGAWWNRHCHLGVEAELDMTPLRETGVVVVSCHASSGQMERIIHVGARVATSLRTGLTAGHTEDLSHLAHHY